MVSGVDAVTRRRFLKGVGAVTAGTLVPGLLAACGGGGSSTHGAITQSGHASVGLTPGRGGNLRLATIGNGSSETFNPAIINTPIDFLHAYSVFDPLVRPAPNYQTAPGLAVAWQPNRDNSVWEIKLRQGVTWHDGKPFGADDVIYTLRGMGSPAHYGHSAVVNIRLGELKKIDAHTVRVPLKAPDNRLSDRFVYGNMALVVQDGAKDFAKPIGTGPYKLVSFSPGHQAVLTANRDYWDHPYPYPDQFEIIAIDDDTARLNALASGAVDMICPVPYAIAKQALRSSPSGYDVLVSEPGQPMTFYMRVDQAPFSDNRVREAIKLAIDRPALIDATFSGIGTIGNDILGKGLPLYDTSLPQRVQDIEKAKSLLKSAGQSDLRLTLNTSESFGGQIQAATAVAQQLGQAGMTVNLKTQQAASYFNPTLLYLKMAFAQSVWPVASLQSYYGQALLSSSSQNETHFTEPAFDQLYNQALAARSDSEEQELWNRLQAIQYQRGGNIAWVYQQPVLGYRSNVRGLYPTGAGWLYLPQDCSIWRWGLA
jgi:peptide/nickel transport system substrate-binding protein